METNTKPKKWWIIINKKIAESDYIHPLCGRKDKTIFLNFLKKDLKINYLEYLLINGKTKNKLFRIFTQKTYYDITLDTTDSGGRSKPTEKVEIPYPTIKQLIINNNKILILNIYIPLKEDGKTLDDENRIYLIVKPSDIYTSTSISKGTYSSSSRWVNLNDIIKVINNKNWILNGKNKNVYIVHWSILSDFLKNTLNSQYNEMNNNNLDILLEETKTADNLIKTENYQKFRNIFRELLIADRGIKCEIDNCNIGLLELMISSHIKPVNKIVSSKLSNEDKIKEITDINNGFLFCPNHDKVFDRFLISFNSSGSLLYSKKIENCIEDIYNTSKNSIKTKVFIYVKNEMNKYLDFHRNEFDKKWNE